MRKRSWRCQCRRMPFSNTSAFTMKSGRAASQLMGRARALRGCLCWLELRAGRNSSQATGLRACCPTTTASSSSGGVSTRLLQQSKSSSEVSSDHGGPFQHCECHRFFGPAERMVILSNGCITQHHGTREFEQPGTRYRLAASVDLSLELQHVTTFIAE